MTAIVLSKAKCHFCKKNTLWGGLAGMVIDLRKLNIKKYNWSLGGLCLHIGKPTCKLCLRKVKNLFV